MFVMGFDLEKRLYHFEAHISVFACLRAACAVDAALLACIVRGFVDLGDRITQVVVHRADVWVADVVA